MDFPKKCYNFNYKPICKVILNNYNTHVYFQALLDIKIPV